MPLPAAFRRRLAAALPAAAIISEPEQLRTYECDALTGHRAVPELVVLPAGARRCRRSFALCHEHGVPFVARGAGTGLSGGALPVADGIVISLARLNRVLEVDLEHGRVVVEPGVTNLDDHEGGRRRTASTTRPTRRASRSARSAATSPRTRAAPTA